MKEIKYPSLKKAIIKHEMTLTQVTNSVNLFLDGTHVCEQELLNYMTDTETMPEDVKEALEDVFDLELADENV